MEGARLDGLSVGELVVGARVGAAVGRIVSVTEPMPREALSIDMPASDVSVPPSICAYTLAAATLGIMASTITLPASTLNSISDDEMLPALARAAETAAICVRPNADTDPARTRRSVLCVALAGDGGNVGLGVGDGTSVGTGLGAAVGAGVGVEVGARVGEETGASDGANVGAAVEPEPA